MSDKILLIKDKSPHEPIKIKTIIFINNWFKDFRSERTTREINNKIHDLVIGDRELNVGGISRLMDFLRG